jgi:hypothetical protein
MFCSSCGSEISGDYCSLCGLRAVKQKVTLTGNPSTDLTIVLAGVAALLLLGFVTFTSSPRESQEIGDTGRYSAHDLNTMSGLRRQMEDCQESKDRACVKWCARQIYFEIDRMSSKDGIDRSTLRQKMAEVYGTGDLGYIPGPRR